MAVVGSGSYRMLQILQQTPIIWILDMLQSQPFHWTVLFWGNVQSCCRSALSQRSTGEDCWREKQKHSTHAFMDSSIRFAAVTCYTWEFHVSPTPLGGGLVPNGNRFSRFSVQAMAEVWIAPGASSWGCGVFWWVWRVEDPRLSASWNAQMGWGAEVLFRSNCLVLKNPDLLATSNSTNSWRLPIEDWTVEEILLQRDASLEGRVWNVTRLWFK